MLEVEIKAQSSATAEEGVRRLGKFLHCEAQADTYFQHPSRDFRKTDEALRIREAGGKYLLTYKGPKAAGDLKIRKEIESPVQKNAFDLLESLGFSKALLVKKTREHYSLEGFDVSIDDVEGLGRFIEIESKSVGDSKKITVLAEKLGLKKQSLTTKSYSELLEEARLS